MVTLTHGMSLKSSFRTRALSYVVHSQLTCLEYDQEQEEHYYSCSLFIAESSIGIIVASIDILEFGDPNFFFHR